ncbi:MAG: acyl carrier protein [Bacteroidales bacterium]|nr:acyl carrier protein [Bacteroidales bacterium]
MEKTNVEVLGKVQAILAEKLCVSLSEVKPEASLTSDLGADSLDTVEIIMDIEKAFDIKVPDDAAGQIDTVNDIVNYIMNN